jgi:hypothetical protein
VGNALVNSSTLHALSLVVAVDHDLDEVTRWKNKCLGQRVEDIENEIKRLCMGDVMETDG